MRAARSKSKSSLFLIELLIMIAFFALSSSLVAVPLFVKAHILSMDSRDLNRAISVSQSAAETFKAANGDARKAAGLLGGFIGADEEVLLYYDSRWQPAAEQDKNGYTMRMITRMDGDIAIADIAVFKAADGQGVFSLQASRHVAVQDRRRAL